MRVPYAALGALALLVQAAGAQKVSYSDTTGLTFYQGTKTQRVGGDPVPTGVYTTYKSKITLTGAATSKTHTGTSSGTSTGSASGTYTTGSVTMGGNLTATATDSVPQPTNTQPCNNYVELCSRKFGNITQVGCHNSPFVRPGNSGSNQELPVKTQLDDGVRFLQAQIQWPPNGTVPHFCHTTCDLLDAGPITEWLGEVYEWVDAHPYDVVTILLGNGNYSDPALYVPFIEQTGILKYTFVPTVFPMTLEDWPTLENMILHGNRVVMFLDYKANQTAFPWLMDEFSQMWETQFDPVDRAFPCTVQRPPDLSADAARDRLYLMNHNLNAEFNVFNLELLVPAVSLLNETNAADGYGSLGLAANNCRADWGRAPNVLNVDYYNYGSPPGSVFEAAARINNVTYNRPCCGQVQSSGAWSLLRSNILQQPRGGGGGDGLVVQQWAVGLFVFFAAMEWSPLTQSLSSLLVRFPLLLFAWYVLCTPYTLRLILGLPVIVGMAAAVVDGIV